MKAFAAIARAAGTPALVRVIGAAAAQPAIVARWKLGGGCVETDSVDAVRLSLRLSTATSCGTRTLNGLRRSQVLAE